MPVNLLLCEGNGGSLDIQVLSAVLRGVGVEVKPEGSKHWLDNRILAYREILSRGSGASVFGLRDGDFPDRPGEWSREENVVEWSISPDNNPIHLGWKWARKEIENYLLDPTVVSRTLRFTEEEKREYSHLLDEAASEIRCSQAARMAVSAHRKGNFRIDNTFDRELTANESDMREVLERRLEAHAARIAVRADAVIDEYNALLPLCAPDGTIGQRYMYCFSGKDLCLNLWKAGRSLSVGQRKLPNKGWMFGKVLEALRTTPDAHRLIPEWHSLREAMMSVDSSDN